jgi:Flp pilus assembly protein, ATPase CpaF
VKGGSGIQQLVDTLERLGERLLEQIDLSRELSDEEVYEYIDSLIIRTSKEQYITLEEKEKLRKSLFDSVRKLDILQDLLEDSTITEIMVNGIENIFIEKRGAIHKHYKKFANTNKLQDVIQQIVAKCNRVVNAANPIVDARLQNGDRVNIVLSPVALNGPILTIRRFPEKPITIEELVSWKSITLEAINFLENLVIAGYNIFISGGTGSGKTTLLNALSNFIPSDERIITIEDNAELQIQGIDNIVKLEVRNPNSQGENGINIRDLIKSSLRMRPDRLIIGEVRGAEALDMLQAMNTGHDGSLSSGHGNNAVDMLRRLETMILMGVELPLEAIRRQIASGIDLLVHLGRLRDRTRKVLEIIEIVGFKDGEILTSSIFSYEEDIKESSNTVVHGELKRVGRLSHIEKIVMAGIKEEEINGL